jgi:ribosomal protein S18 acetylase RimI-like enzyme
MISAETRIAGTECHDPLVACAEGVVAGVICSFPLEDLQARQMQSILHVMRSLDRSARKEFRETMVTGNHSVAPICVSAGLYIARIAVATEMQGRGIGNEMLLRFIENAAGQPITLHVDRQNAAAVRLYERFGFVFDGRSDEARKRAMVRV